MVCRISELAGLDILYLDARKEESVIDPHADAADVPIAEIVKLGVWQFATCRAFAFKMKNVRLLTFHWAASNHPTSRALGRCWMPLTLTVSTLSSTRPWS